MHVIKVAMGRDGPTMSAAATAAAAERHDDDVVVVVVRLFYLIISVLWFTTPKTAATTTQFSAAFLRRRRQPCIFYCGWCRMPYQREQTTTGLLLSVWLFVRPVVTHTDQTFKAIKIKPSLHQSFVCLSIYLSVCLFFLPCDALRCTVLVIVILSVRPSVSLSVTLVDCVHTVRPTIMISAPYGSPIILVSGDIKFISKFEGGHPERGRWMRVGWIRIGDFRTISRRISKTVRDTTKVTINH